MKIERWGAVVLAGGTARRMNRESKALLSLSGRTFLDSIAGALSGFEELILSANDPRLSGHPLFRAVADLPVHVGKGPMAGLYAALSSAGSDALMVVPCDMPLFSGELAVYLKSFAQDGYDAWTCETRDGLPHPLCGVYTKACLPALAQCLAENDLRMTGLLARVRSRRVSLAHTEFPDTVLSNINTPDDLARLRREVAEPKILAVCGVKNSGKTTLLERLIPLLTTRGIRVGVIKHDGHDFEPDVPGTDSHRLRLAGAVTAAVISHERYLLTSSTPGISPSALAGAFKGLDLLLLEGFKGSGYPKIELVRGAVSAAPAASPRNLLALCSDLPEIAGDLPCFGLEAYEALAAFILEKTGLSR